jgi:DNA-binding XRE family transcriptional regulator
MIQPRNEPEKQQLLRALMTERFGPLPPPPPTAPWDVDTLRAARVERRWTQHEVARRLRVRRSRVKDWECGESEIPDRWARAYQALFDEEAD